MSDALTGDETVHRYRSETGGWRAWPHRGLRDGRLLAVEPLLMGGGRLHVIDDETSTASSEFYEWVELVDAAEAMHRWTTTAEPDGWCRHKPSNRRRPFGDPTQEYVAP